MNRSGVKTCEDCGKRCYISRREAKAVAKALYPGEQLSAYQCGDYWHYGHIPNAVRHGVLPRGAQQ